MKKTWIGFLYLLSLLPFCGAAVHAQATSRVTGLVQDTTGGALVGASVNLINEATGVSVSTVTTSAGTYIFDGIAPGRYTVSVVAQGFSTFTAKGNTLTIAQPIVVNATMRVGEATEKVVVNVGAELVQTEDTGDLGALIDQRALTTLPIVGARGRSPLALLELVPGVVDGGPLNSTGANIEGGGVAVNGSRDRAWNYTLDGIDINETSAPGSNFSPLRTNPDSIEGFRVITSNANAEYGVTSGAQVILETRPGTNEFHGNVFWFYQTPGLNANDPGNKENRIGRPQFVQHIPGFSVGGPIFKNKTFFFVNTQLLHASQDFTNTSLVYTQSARNGLIRYLQQSGSCVGSTDSSCPHNNPAGATGAVVDTTGNPLPGLSIGTYDVAANDSLHLGLDASIQKFIGLTPQPNNFTVGDGLNTAGYTFQAPEQERQVDFTVRIDHNFNSKNSIFGRWAHGHQNTIGDIGNAGLQPFPNAPNIVNTDRQPRNLAISWRYTPSSSVTNEVIAGMNRFIFNFVNPDSHYLNNPPFVLNGDGLLSAPNPSFGSNLASPLQNYVGNLRVLTALQLVDNLSYIRGQHAFKFGANLRYQRHIDDRGSIGIYDAQPLVLFNTSVAPVDSTAFKVPANVNGAIDIASLDNAVNNLLGRIGSIQQGFVAQNANRFAPTGQHLQDDFRMPEYDFYAQDSWKIRPNLTINVGIRWEIKLSPRVSSNFRLHPNQPFTVDAPPSDALAWVPGQLYNDAWRSFAPSFGIAWDPFKNGRQSIRADYRLAYDRMNTFVISSAVFEGLPGETLPLNNPSFAGQRLSAGIPTLTPPPGETPLALRQPAPFSTSSITAIDPHWKPPQVHEWSLSVQRQVTRDTVFEVAYIGKHAVHLFGGYDSNQAQSQSNGFLSAFKTVAAGGDSPLIDQLVANDAGYTALLGGGATATGSQYLSGVCIQPDQSNPCSGSPYASDFSFGSVAAVAAELGSVTTANGQSLPVAAGLSPSFFFKYPQFAGQTASPGFVVLDSSDWSWYNGLQTSYHGRFHGLQFQTNYTWSKSMDTRSFDPTFGTVIGGSTTFGASSTPFDNEHRRLNYAPSDFDRTHVFQAIWTYEVPFGRARKWVGNWGPALDHFIGGWEIAGSAVAESGRPTTIYSPAYTTSSIVRTPASCNGCTHDMLHVHYNPDTGGLNYLTTAQMNMFFTPGPGNFSNIGRNFFRLAPYSVVNLSLGKVTRITERHAVELRVEMQNAFNYKHYDQPASIRTNSGVFGAIDAATVENAGLVAGSSPRTIQLSAKYTF
jgi:hypothetical protein